MIVLRNVRTRRWCVYMHYVDGECVYIGMGDITRPFEKTRRGKLWSDFTRDKDMDIIILEMFDERRDAYDLEQMLIEVMKPRCNIRGTRKGQKRMKRFECVQTGEVFEYYKDASIATGIPTGYVSQILNGHVNRIKGFSFRYCE